MTREQLLLKKMRYNTNHAEGNGAVSPIVTTGNGDQIFRLGQGAFQPPFKAQIQQSLLKFYFTEAATVYTPVAAGAIAATLQTDLPFFVFGNADFASGYPTLQANFPIGAIWVYGDPFVFGKDLPRTAFSNLDANATALLQKVDVVFPFTAVTAGPVNTVALLVVRSADVPYANLLASTNSNLFKINMIRYGVADSTAGQLAQYSRPIVTLNITMFGKEGKDTTNPNSFKNPEQNQANIVDVLIKVEITKEKALAVFSKFDVVAIDWNLFIEAVMRL